MKNKRLKILVLIWFILVFLFPLAATAGLTDEIAAWLTGRGFGVRETAELQVLVPESGVRFEIANLDGLVKGWNTLALTLYCGETVYAKTGLKVFLESVPGAAADRSPSVRQTRTGDRPAAVKPGDRVNILFRAGGLVIRSSGKVLRSAGLGETTDVLNISFNTVVKAVVRDPKNVILK
jgi:hypothetical protein